MLKANYFSFRLVVHPQDRIPCLALQATERIESVCDGHIPLVPVLPLAAKLLDPSTRGVSVNDNVGALDARQLLVAFDEIVIGPRPVSRTNRRLLRETLFFESLEFRLTLSRGFGSLCVGLLLDGSRLFFSLLETVEQLTLLLLKCFFLRLERVLNLGGKWLLTGE